MSDIALAAAAQAIDFRARQCIQNPYPTYAQLREFHPVLQLTEGTWLLSRYEDVAFALKRYDLFATGWLASPMIQPDWLPEECKRGIFLTEKDPPEHARYSAVINKAFVPRSFNALMPFMQRKVDALLATARRCRSIDFLADFAYPFAASVIGRITGLNTGETVDCIRHWVELMESLTVECPANAQRRAVEDLIHEQNRYFDAIVDDRRLHPRDDLATALAFAQIGGKPLTANELRSAFESITTAGFHPPAQQLANAVIALARRPELVAQLQTRPELIPAFIEEVLRYSGNTQGLLRTTTRAVALHGVTIPAGAQVMALIGSANRDPAIFPDPDIFHCTRVNAKRHLAFGHGPHTCIGAALARLELRTVIKALLTAFQQFECPPDDKLDWLDVIPIRSLGRLPVYLQ